MTRITAAVLSVALATGAAACSDKIPSGPDDTSLKPLSGNPPPGMVVSNPRASSSTSSFIGVRSSAAVSATTVAYISVAPGTFPGAASAAVRNQTRGGASQSVQVIEGGFDPVGIDAEVGDELSLTVSMTGGGSTSMAVKVPPRRPPEVVRTNPSKGRTDVALNVQIVVVFSEPVDKSSATSSSVALLQDRDTVNGRVQVSADGLTAEFIPDSPLQPQTTYSLVINQGIRDLDGDALGDAFTVTFMTDGPVPLPPVNGNIAFTTDRHGEREIYVMNPDGTNQVRLTNNTIVDDFPAWSPDRQKIAFLSGTSGQHGIYTMNADGTGKTLVTALTGAGSWPFYEERISWSPDGGRIAFHDVSSNRLSVFVVNIDGTNRVRINDDGRNPAWSPDGSKIMFSRETTPGYGFHLYTMNPNGTGVTLVVTGAGDPNSTYSFNNSEWSPTGEQIICGATYWEDFLGVFVSQADGTNRQLVAGHFTVGNADRPDWAPEGARFVFADLWVRQIFVGNVDGSPRIQLTTLGNNFSPAW